MLIGLGDTMQDDLSGRVETVEKQTLDCLVTLALGVPRRFEA